MTNAALSPLIRSGTSTWTYEGPGLKEGVTIPAFENVHIYSYLAEILGLPISQENEGRMGWLRQQVSQ